MEIIPLPLDFATRNSGQKSLLLSKKEDLIDSVSYRKVRRDLLGKTPMIPIVSHIILQSILTMHFDISII